MLKEKQTAVLEAQKEFYAIQEDYSLRDAKIAEKYMLICEALKDFIGANMLPGKGAHAFSIDSLCKSRYSVFINEVCQPLGRFVNKPELTASCQSLWDKFQSEKDAFSYQTEQELMEKRLEIVTSLSEEMPDELTPHSLSAEMQALASREGKLGGWLPCDAVYTQLWAILHNLNLFVFAGEPQFILMNRFADQPYTQQTIVYPLGTQTHLATAIITSSSAKNIFLLKGQFHYDKLIDPRDFIAIAKQVRHVQWASLEEGARYSAYPTKIQTTELK